MIQDLMQSSSPPCDASILTFVLAGQTGQPGQQSGVKHHFVTYVVNSKNQLVELDGTKKGPHVVAEGVQKDGLMIAVAEEIKRKLAEGEVSESMSLMAIGPPNEMW